MWGTRSKLEEQNRLLIESVTATALKVNERDEHIRALTESATAMVLKLEERESEIAALNKRVAELDKHSRLQTVMEARRHCKQAQAHIGNRWRIWRDRQIVADEFDCAGGLLCDC
jgi:hypothetical protein